MKFSGVMLCAFVLPIFLLDQSIAAEKEQTSELSDKGIQPPSAAFREIKCQWQTLIRNDRAICFRFMKSSNSGLVRERCQPKQSGPREYDLKAVRVGGKDHCTVKEAFRHKPDCSNKFNKSAKGRLVIQNGPDSCVAGTEQFRPQCQANKFAHSNSVYWIEVDGQGTQDFCVPRKYIVYCRGHSSIPSNYQLLAIKPEIDGEGHRDICMAEYYEFRRPQF